MPRSRSSYWVRIEGSEGRLELGWGRIGDGCLGLENHLGLASAFADVAAMQVQPWVTDADLARAL